jgi:hypothetical protein
MSRKVADPGQLAKRLQKFIHDDVYDGSRFETTFGFRAEISLSEGMRREVDFLRRQAAC